ncbi:hypothetical protein [Nostoc sp.]|uniref:hypothetical protein n=1 Tax=Nostoc sp. TaxID=1180 RepID=UPI002FF5202A
MEMAISLSNDPLEGRKNQRMRSHLMNVGLMPWNLINSLELHSPEVTTTTADSITEWLSEKGFWKFF